MKKDVQGTDERWLVHKRELFKYSIPYNFGFNNGISVHTLVFFGQMNEENPPPSLPSGAQKIVRLPLREESGSL